MFLPNAIYPEKYKDEISRAGKKFKYFRIEPIDLYPKKEEKINQIKPVGDPSGRINYILRNNQHPYVENIWNELSYSDLISEVLQE